MKKTLFLGVIVVLAMALVVGCSEKVTKNYYPETDSSSECIENAQDDSVNTDPNTDDPMEGLYEFWDGFWFDVSSLKDGTIILTLNPYDSGIEGDGFMVEFAGEEYFLPEGKELRLLPNHQYEMFISRVFNSERGLILGGGQYFLFNNESGYIESDKSLGLQPIGEISWYLYEPEIILNLSSSSLSVNSYEMADDVKIEFYPLEDNLETIVYYVYQFDTVALPSDSWYSSVEARSRLYDEMNERVIVSEPVFVDYHK